MNVDSQSTEQQVQTPTQNSDSRALQPILATQQVVKPRRSNKPPHVKALVIAKRYVENRPISQIAKDLEISRPTVYAILDEANLDKQIECGRGMSARLIPEAIRVAEVRLSQNSENMAIKVLENTIWPLNGKAPKSHDAGLVLAIQNLMGNVTVAQAATQVTPAESTPICVPSDTERSAELPKLTE